MLCEYGCGGEAIYKFGNGKWCCSKNHKSCLGMKNKGMPDPKTNPANKKVVCKFCQKEFSLSNLKKHENKCYNNPDNIKLCPVCGIQLKKLGNKFCSKNCAATYNNTKRKHIIKTRRKISKSLGGLGKLSELDYYCKRCKIKVRSIRKYCNECLKETRSELAIERNCGDILSKI